MSLDLSCASYGPVICLNNPFGQSENYTPLSLTQPVTTSKNKSTNQKLCKLSLGTTQMRKAAVQRTRTAQELCIWTLYLTCCGVHEKGWERFTFATVMNDPM